MTKLLLSVTLLLPIFSYSQTTDRNVVSSAGSYVVDAESGISFSQTIGENIVFTSQNPSFTFTQGFQQPDVDWNASIETQFANQFESSVWPNPFENQLSLAIKSSRNTNLVVSFSDLAGRKISSDQAIQVSSTLTTWNIAVENLAAGIYLIQIRNNQGELITTHRVNKSH